jgi:hypothetical protein
VSTPPSPHNPRPPRFFLDRNLGRIAVPRGLRDAGVELSLAERYGVPADERITEPVVVSSMKRSTSLVDILFGGRRS